jgi:hypothetical protein
MPKKKAKINTHTNAPWLKTKLPHNIKSFLKTTSVGGFLVVPYRFPMRGLYHAPRLFRRFLGHLDRGIFELYLRTDQ